MVKESQTEIQGGVRVARVQKPMAVSGAPCVPPETQGDEADSGSGSVPVREASQPCRVYPEDYETLQGDNGPYSGSEYLSVSSKSAASFFKKGESFRTGQREAIEKIEAAFQRGHKFVIYEGLVGSGKSWINMALAEKYGYTNVLTVQKILQSQYAKDFPNVAIMMGRSAYPCKVGGNCSMGLCRADPKLKHSDCAYTQALKKAISSPITVHNFDSYYYQGLHIDFGYRNLLVVDECASLEPKFLQFMEFSISNYRNPLLKIPNFGTLEMYDFFLRQQLSEFQDEYDSLEGSGDKNAIRRRDDLGNIIMKLNKYFFYRAGTEYVFEYKDMGGHQTLMVKPVLVGNFVKDFLLEKAERVLMTSATILSKKLFCDSIGVDPEGVVLIKGESTFPAKNRPIFYNPIGRMGYSYIDRNLPLLVKRIRKLLKAHEGERGIIQCHSDKIMKYIAGVIDDPRLTLRSDFASVDDLLKVHELKADSVIVASGLREGLDLKDDLSRFQIICKIPYPSMADKRVARRKELNKFWYIYCTAIMLIQMLGRSVRSEVDTAVTYILDGDFERFSGMASKLIPGYIKEAFK